MAEEGEVEGEQEGEEVYNDVDPYAYDPNEVQEDEEGMPLGQSLVIQRLLLTPRVEYGDQRNEIFRAWCTISKRVCDLIIDNDNVENIASKSLVTKLGLKTEKHFGYQARTENRKASLSVQDRLDQERYGNSCYSTMPYYFFYG